MKLIQAIKAIQFRKGVVRCIDENGEVYSEYITDGISIDVRWLVKTGEVDYLL